MLSKRGAELVFLALLSLIVAACSAVVLSIAWFGLDSHLPARTFKATALGWLVGFPVALLAVGSIRWLTARLAR
ncbi:MAG: hypothetical protein KF691_15360 [Phycisphaeraceae bacterium]|nr:hypothetical protein [Phycisphaeraceae bacterium]